MHLFRRVGLRNCPYCGSSEIYASSPKTSWERLPVLFLFRLVRCHSCMRRHLRPIILPEAKEPRRRRLPETPTAVVSPETDKRSA